MQYVNLVCAHADMTNLREFAVAFFEATGISDVQERESSNYLEGRYFKGSRHGTEYTVSLLDEDDYEDFPVWVQVAANLEVTGTLEEAVNQVVRELLLTSGFRVARVLNFGKHGEQRVEYA